jgi:phosphatidylserine/phosphatidylglycerophosphate/cardiolipin synthase-like enzyme
MGIGLLWALTAWAGEVQVYTDREIRPALLEALRRAERMIDVEMYVLSDVEVIEALERAEARGAAVRVILDPHQASNQRHLDRLKAGGVEVKWFPVNQPAQMHRKLAILDGTRVLAGSVNWTANGLERNEELLLVLDDPEAAQQLSELFAADWYESWLGHQRRY